MSQQKGMAAKVSWGVETTPGTEEARTGTSRVASCGLAAHRIAERVPHLVPSGSTRAPRAMFSKAIDINGPVEMPAAYSGQCLGLLLEAAMGAVSTSPSSGSYAHTFTLGASLLALSVAVERGVGASLGDEEFYGVKVGMLELSVAPGALMMLKLDLIGMSNGVRGGDSPPALATPNWISHAHAGTLSFNSVNYKLSSFVCRIDNKLARLDELGSLYSSEPEVTDFQSVEFEVELVARSDALYAAHLAQTASDAVITFSDGTRSIVFTLHNAEIDTYEDPLSDPGVIKQKVKFVGVGDDTKNGLQIVLTNASSSSRTA